MDELITLCGANSYTKKFYLNEDFNNLPKQIKDELKVMCVLFVADVGGILTLQFDEEGNLNLNVTCEEGDYRFDEIGSVLKVKEIQRDKQELMASLEMYYRVFYLED